MLAGGEVVLVCSERGEPVVCIAIVLGRWSNGASKGFRSCNMVLISTLSAYRKSRRVCRSARRKAAHMFRFAYT